MWQIQLMLKNVRCLRGVLALDSVCCKVKGGSIPDLENDRDALVEAWLSARIEWVLGFVRSSLRLILSYSCFV